MGISKIRHGDKRSDRGSTNIVTCDTVISETRQGTYYIDISWRQRHVTFSVYRPTQAPPGLWLPMSSPSTTLGVWMVGGGGVPMSHVDYKKLLCCSVEFKKRPCRPIEFKKRLCRPVDFKIRLCRMSLRPKNNIYWENFLE